MTTNLVTRARRKLFAVWLTFFAANLGVALYLYLDHWIETDNFQALISQLNSSYVTYVGMMVTFFVSANRSSITTPHSSAAFLVALSGSLLWNLLVAVLVWRLVLGVGTVEESVAQIAFIAPPPFVACCTSAGVLFRAKLRQG
jgi:hypothetical protein